MADRIPFILDCDPGHDDALALVVGLARPELRLLAVTTVAGNAGLRETTRNALRVLTLLGRTDIPVAAGAAGPLVRSLHVADDVHGASGLEGADLPEPASAVRPEGAIELLRATLEAAPEPVSIAAVGPLTNIALLIRTHPELVDRIANIRVMGGAITEGNTTASAEFNIWQDPEAARVVFECGRPITLMTLDTTHQALFTTADVDRLEALGTHTASVFADLLRFFARFHAQRYGWDGAPIHDAVSVAHLAVPSLVRTVPYRVDVETSSDLTRGRTVVDLYAQTGRPPNVDVGREIDRGSFVELLIDAVRVMGAAEAVRAGAR
jgi:pyrimidine-specific ribonucleoside hydrolase